MKALILVLLSIVFVSSCDKKEASRSAALPDNLVSDKPIVLKEGQGVVLMMDGDSDLMIAAAVVDGKLSVGEVDPHGSSVGVIWKDSETWETSTTSSDGTNSTTILDRDGDGYADFRAVHTSSGLRRYELKGDVWIELK